MFWYHSPVDSYPSSAAQKPTSLTWGGHYQTGQPRNMTLLDPERLHVKKHGDKIENKAKRLTFASPRSAKHMTAEVLIRGPGDGTPG